MSTKRLLVVVAVLAAGLVVSFYSKGRAQAPVPSARCVVTVPRDWGEFLNASQYGLVFKDKDGTLRFIQSMPCGFEGRPNINLEVHRN